MKIKIAVTFDVGGKRHYPGDLVDIDPTIAKQWIAEGRAKLDADSGQKPPVGYGSEPGRTS
jgi:hypothetical protein